MPSREEFMKYVDKRLKEKEKKQKKLTSEVIGVQVAGIERCSKGRWRQGQR